MDESDEKIARVLSESRVYAVVGASANAERPSYGVMEYLIAKGREVIPVNPGFAGREILGQTVYARLADIPGPVDVIDIFRASDAAGGVVDEAIAEKARLQAKVIWMQLGVINEEAARRAEAAGFTVIMNRCPKIEFARLRDRLA